MRFLFLLPFIGLSWPPFYNSELPAMFGHGTRLAFAPDDFAKRASVQFEHFTTESYPAQQRPIAWQERLRQHRLRPEAGVDASRMHGTLIAGRTPRGVELARIASSPQTLERLGDDSDAVWLALHMAGDATLFDGERATEVLPGDIVYGPASAAPQLMFRSNFRQFMVLMPGRALKARLPETLTIGVGSLPGRSGMGRMFAGTLNALSEAFDTLADDELAPIEVTLSEFIASTFSSAAPGGPTRMNASQAAMMRRVRQFIEGGLSEPELTLAALARRERVSERLLQKLFESSGQTFSAHVRQRRLERCRADLSNRLYGHLSISDICFRWGFNDSAHFSHAFRDQYNISPRQYRQQANEAGQQSLRRTIQRGWPAGYHESSDGSTAPSKGTTAAVADSARIATDEDPTPPATHPGSAGQHHHLPANHQTVHWGYFSRSIPPVLTVDSGDIVTIETLTQHAYDDHDRMIKGDSGAESVFHWTAEKKNVDRRGAGPVDASIYGRGSGEGFGVHICTGPIYVRDAEPGDVLVVRILDLMPRLAANAKYQGRAFGSNAAAWWGFHYDELLTEPKPREVVTIYEIDCSQGGGCAHAVYNFRWTPQRDPNGVMHPTIDYPGIPVDRSTIVENHGVLKNVKIPTRPHFGVIAVAPVEAGLVDSIPPAYFGGNIDNWRVAKGATVYLRVGVDGALLSVGDPHASQGDSELCGTAIECSLTGVFQIVLHKAKDLGNQPYADINYPLVETPDEWVLHGFSHPDYLKEFGDKARSEIYEKSSLDLAMRDAFRKTRRFLMTAKGLSEDEAISLMSVAVDFGVTQVVDGNWGVHAVIRKALFDDERFVERRSC
jgi:acetamidase/formamidase/AraC-like DNA-binding protein